MWTKYTGSPNIPNYSQCLVAVSRSTNERLLLVAVYVAERGGFVVNGFATEVLLCEKSPEFYYHVLDPRLQVDDTSVDDPLCMSESDPENSLDLWPKQ